MKIGIFSETHGHVARTKLAIDLLIENGAETLIHCGDIGSESVMIEIFSRLECIDVRFHAVLGNVDYSEDEFAQWEVPGKVEIMGRFGELIIDEKRIAVIHGDNGRLLDNTIKCGQYDYVFTGHTHVMQYRQVDMTQIINPGAVYRAPRPSVAVLDLVRDQLEFLYLENLS